MKSSEATEEYLNIKFKYILKICVSEIETPVYAIIGAFDSFDEAENSGKKWEEKSGKDWNISNVLYFESCENFCKEWISKYIPAK